MLLSSYLRIAYLQHVLYMRRPNRPTRLCNEQCNYSKTWCVVKHLVGSYPLALHRVNSTTCLPSPPFPSVWRHVRGLHFIPEPGEGSARACVKSLPRDVPSSEPLFGKSIFTFLSSWRCNLNVTHQKWRTLTWTLEKYSTLLHIFSWNKMDCKVALWTVCLFLLSGHAPLASGKLIYCV